MAAVDERVVDDHAKGRIISDAPLSRPVPVGLRYDPEFSPATVRFVFPGDVEWSFPRTLLETGLRTPTRRGDIEVWPCGRVQTVVEFHRADGVAVVQFDTVALVRFLRHTYDAGTPTPPARR
ncbi:SsgA family sporulation/cell division regulator [Streptomyces sp. NBC_00094]|uniref:SsgA family sporulation/cell division regulator n=1 Tax=Streptomyces sp. NBC_00094 TaxID=2903620 RepID=UPI00224F2E8D|nr:SsgA family sporulation/cell division regulator [Streptomyces sp. NBC_00094]MCX5391238.1 SsgA family sporulation/cell division regulator [Streptomyces sp. NBC_00094]